MQAAVAVYPTFTALDIVRPLQVLPTVPDVNCGFVGQTRVRLSTTPGRSP
jgi:hypothetical protein